MRALPMAMLMLALALADARAAPICQSREGDFVHCDAPGAMPVGWHVPPDQFRARVLARAPQPQDGELFLLGGFLAALFALIALLPRFDGSKDEDWDRQEGDG